MLEHNGREQHLQDRETNSKFLLTLSEHSVNIICPEWFPREIAIPRDVWSSFIAHPIGGRHTDRNHCLWHWSVGDYAVIARETISGMSTGVKTVVKIPKVTWERMLALNQEHE